MIIKSLEHLQLISKRIVDKISEKDCIFLVGEIGAGKTTFTRSLINSLQKKEGVEETEVLSPTFNLLHEYDIKKIKVMHYDLYRIKDNKELDQLGIFSENMNSIWMNYKIKKISGDASFREFYRVKKNNKTSIIVFAKKEELPRFSISIILLSKYS